MSFVKWAAAVTLAALVTMAGGVANANTVTIFNGASQKGTLSDLGGSGLHGAGRAGRHLSLYCPHSDGEPGRSWHSGADRKYLLWHHIHYP